MVNKKSVEGLYDLSIIGPCRHTPVIDELDQSLIYKWSQVRQGNEERWNERTLSENSNGFTEVTRLTIDPLGILKHAGDETELAKQAMFPRAIQRDMRLGQTPNRIDVVHRLDHGVRI